MGKKGQRRIYLPWRLKLSSVDGSVYRHFYSNILLPFFLCLMGSLPNVDTELFYFMAATKLLLIRTERKGSESLWSFHSISSREAHTQSFRVLRFFLEKMLCCHKCTVFRAPCVLAYFSPFVAVIFPWVVAVQWAQSWK